MRYRIRHATEFAYDEPVTLCHNVARLRPRACFGQVCTRFDLFLDPRPAYRRDRVDFFGNPATDFSLEEPHHRLSVVSELEVDLASAVAPPPGPPWESAVHPLEARAFAFSSPLAQTGRGPADYARVSFTPGRPLVEAALDLSGRIHADFRFVPGATTVGTPVDEVLRKREGVCQDFAHLEIACLRSLGLAARYVSGYALTDPPEGGERIPGGDASHAWLSVFIPGWGWLDVDPTRGRRPDATHATLGWGRDYADLPPLKGVLLGGSGQSLKVAVDMIPLA